MNAFNCCTMSKFFLFICCLFAFTVNSVGQTGEIRGVLWDDDCDCPLPFASAYVEQEGHGLIGTTTDMEGVYRIYPLTAGNYDVKFQSLGFASVEVQNIEVGLDSVTWVDTVIMKLDQSTFVVCEFPPYFPRLIDYDDVSKMTLLPAEIEQTPMAKAPATYANYILPIQYDETNQLHIRGARPGSVIYFVDGVKVGNELNGVPPSSVGSYTIYASGVPAKYGDAMGGVILIETKSYFDLYKEHQRKTR